MPRVRFAQVGQISSQLYRVPFSPSFLPFSCFQTTRNPYSTQQILSAHLFQEAFTDSASTLISFFLFFFKLIYFIYLFLAALGLHRCEQALSRSTLTSIHMTTVYLIGAGDMRMNYGLCLLVSFFSPTPKRMKKPETPLK